MSRRTIFLIGLFALALVGAATAPWTLSEKGLSAALSEHMRERYGFDITVEGRSTIALLPVPRVKFEKVTLALAGGALKAEGGTLRGELRILPLLIGQIELSDMMLSHSRITASAERLEAFDWAEFVKKRAEATYVRRLIVVGSTLRWTDWEEANLNQINLVVTWAGADKPLYAVGSAQWRDENVSLEQALIDPILLATNQLSPFALTIAAPSGRLAATGEVLLGDDPRMTGESTIQWNSVRSFTAWSGMRLPFGSLINALSIKGDFSLNRRRLTWPSVAVTLGSDKLDGTLSVRFDMPRPLIAGTLAAGRLNLSPLFSPFLNARTAAGTWSEEEINLSRVTGSNLDLRLSASTAIVGPLRLGDMAASILVRPDRIEASVGRADFYSGGLKGRLSLAAAEGGVEFKTQGNFNDVETSSVLTALGQRPWISGRAQGQFQVEGIGQSVVDMIRRTSGRSSIAVKDGDLIGIALGDALRSAEKRPLLASLQWKGGRTPFEHAQAHVTVKGGTGEVSDSRLVSPDVVAVLQGQVSLIERSLNLKADVSPAASAGQPAALGIDFNVSGGWDNVLIMPDARSLIERSGAARQLMDGERTPASASTTAQ